MGYLKVLELLNRQMDQNMRGIEKLEKNMVKECRLGAMEIRMKEGL